MSSSNAESQNEFEARLTKAFSGSSVEAQIAGDCWLYGHAFIFEGKSYRIIQYYLGGGVDLSVVVTMEPFTSNSMAIAAD